MMTNKFLFVPLTLCIMTLTSCTNKKDSLAVNQPTKTKETIVQDLVTVKPEPHRYGGWYCPDNLFGFPPVDIQNWKNVPVVNGRLPTEEETQNGTSLIFIDTEKYPNSNAIEGITLPKLARVYNSYAKREDIIIVIQAVRVQQDSIVGYRFLNGGNGSARLNEINFLTEKEIESIPKSKFVSHSITVHAPQQKIWDVLTRPEYASVLQPIFDKTKKLQSDWRQATNVNYHYTNAGNLTSKYGNKLFGNYYIQNDYDNNMYNEKILLLENKESKTTEIKIVSGPFINDQHTQEEIIYKWAKMVKNLSEGK